MPDSQDRIPSDALEFIEGMLERLLQSSKAVQKGKIEIPDLPVDAGNDVRRLALRKVLGELSSLDRGESLSDIDIEHLSDFFMDLYRGDPKYRHSYADICSVIFGFADTEDELDDGVPYQVNNLANNVNLVYATMDPASSQAESVQKLCDHIDLERERLRHFVDQRNTIREYDRKRRKLEERSAELGRAAERDRRALEEEFVKKVDAMRMEFIAILGVFAAIVLAFNGAVGFSTSSIQALGTASGVRSLVLVAALVGFVLVNAISILMVFLWKMAFGTRIIIGTWPRNCLIAADVILVLIMGACAALSLPVVRAFFGLPA